MRVLLLTFLIACGGARGAVSPAWPKQHDTENDGGEALAPRAADEVTAAIEKADDEPDAPAPPATAPAASAPDTAAPAAAPAATPTPDDAIMGEDITIEIDE